VELFLAPQMLPFVLAFALMLLIMLLECLGMLLSASPGNLLDNLLPEDFGEGALDRVLGWLHLGKVPSLILLVLFLSAFSLSGYALQLSARGLSGDYLPALLAVLCATPLALFSTRMLGGWIARFIPHDESSAVSEESFVGLVGVVSQGIARSGLAAQARVRDQHGRTHYLLVEPDVVDEQFTEGTMILLVSKSGAIWRCIRNPHPQLLQ